MISHCRHLRSHFHQIFTRRQLYGFTLTVPTQSYVNHEVTRRLSVCTPLLLTTSKPLSDAFYSVHSKEKLLVIVIANRRHLTSQFYRLQSFSSNSSGYNDSRQSERDARTLMVAGLSSDTTVVALRECFRKKWEVTDCRIARHKITGTSRGFGFVEFATVEQLSSLNFAEEDGENEEPSITDVINEENELNQLHFQREAEREGARTQQKRQAEQMLEGSAKRFAPIPVGQTVRVPIPMVDRAKTDPKVVLGVVMQADDGFYRIGTRAGILNQKYARNQIDPSSSKHVSLETVPNNEISLRTAAKHALEFDHKIDGKQVSVKISGNKELEDKYRIFAGGLSKETSSYTLHEHFSQFGDIFECHIVRSEDNLSKGFGYVIYKSQDSVDRALNSQPHSIDNQVVTVKHTPPRRRELTLFIGNLSPKTTDESLREHFSKYGQLTQCNIKTDPKTGQSRGFGYVAFGSQEEHVIDGVEVKLDHKTSELDLVVDSLPQNISEESLKNSLWDFFSRYGQIRDCMLIKNSAGRTTAFVQLSSRDEISRTLNARPHRIDGKLVDTHLKGERFTLIVNGLPKDATDEDLYETFSKVGKPVHWQVMRDWKDKTNRPLGYAYVAFSSAEEVNHVLNCAPHYLVGDKIVNEIPRDIELVPSKNRDLETKDQSQLLEVLRHEKNEKMIIVRGISKETSQDDLRAYFSRFGNVDTCFICRIRDCATGYVGFNSPKTVNHVLDCGPHYNYYNTNDLASEEKLDKDRKDLAEFLAPSKDELTVTLGTLPSITNSDSLKKLFSKYGQVTHINAECKYENGVEKESIYVTFATKEQVVNVLKHQPLFLDGQMLIRSFCDNTILVKNLPKSATEEKLQKIFSEFGELTDWGVKSDGSYGWVSFARPVNVRTLEDKSPTMFGKKLEVEPVKNAQEAEGKNESRMDPKEFEEFQRTFDDDYDHRSKW
ncbi:RNA recognition motif domain-containing protein [Ditylenchus destructor]|nr:RNA recognition motif domain-containing protein [Ditylenchus destructor]